MKRTVFFATTAMLASLGFAMPAAAQDVDEGYDGQGEVLSGEGRTVEIEPYIEANQVVAAQLSPDSDVVTYTQIAAGVDTIVQGRNNGGSLSVRVEQVIGYDDDVLDTTTVSGVARGYASIVPQTLTVEAGALASETRIDGSGASTINPRATEDATSRVYSVYAGPTVHERVGDVEVNANYRVGYTRLDAPDAVVAAPGGQPVDVFEESVQQSAGINAASRPGELLPVGVGVGAGFTQEDVSNLDQRVRDIYGRADVTVPVSPTLAVVAGVGYEDVEVSSRDALRDANGVPVIGDDGRFVTDDSRPRRIAFETDGLIWDAGVVWRPSRRTALEAHVGRRYDSTTYYGSFAWAPNRNTSVNVSVYDGISGFGGLLTNALAALPTEFQASRNALTGDFDGCVTGTTGAGCVTGALGSVRSAIFRGRGIGASIATTRGRTSLGSAVGYNRRTFLAAPGTVLADADGLADETWYATLFYNRELGTNAALSLNSYVNYSESELQGDFGALGYGASAAYAREIFENLSARAAVALDVLDTDLSVEDITTASALLGVRYNF